jgi:hypothetical protein
MNAAWLFRFINNKKFLLAAVFIFFLPFLLFCFWNVPSADDYMILDKKQQFSFWGLQSWVYHTWTGRYLATFISTAFSYSGFLYSHYYVHTILLLSFTVLSWFFLLKQLNRHFVNRQYSFSSLLLASLLLLILEINIVPEPVTAFYWFSSAVTYQLPLILLIFLAGTISRLFFNSDKKKLYSLLAAVLIILVHGCNESITLFVLMISTCLMCYGYATRRKVPVVFVCLYCIGLISPCFLLFSPGIMHRGSLHDTSPFLSIIAIACIKFTVLHWFFLKEPLWWFSLLFISMSLSNNRLFRIQMQKHFSAGRFALLLLVYILSGLFIYVPILYATNGSLPLRTENVICFLYSFMLLLMFSGYILKNTKSTVAFASFYPYRYLLFSILIFSSSNTKKISDTLLSGFFYKQVMQERVNLFEAAKRKHLSEVTFDDYSLAVDKRMKKYPLLNRKSVKDIMQKPPPLICFESDLYDINYMKELYGIKVLHINK